MKYRPELDGLRGVAVLVVFAAHAGVPGFAPEGGLARVAPVGGLAPEAAGPA